MGTYRRRPGGNFYARFWEDGRLKRISLNTADPDDAKFAYELLVRPLRKKKAKRNSTAEPRKTFGEAVDAWMRRIEIDHGDKPATVDNYGVQARRWKRRWGQLPPSAVDRAEVQEWRDERLRKVAKSTAKREMAILRAFLRWAHNEGHLAEVPTIDPIKGVRKKRRAPAILSPVEVERLLTVARTHRNPHLRAMELPILLAANTGLRRDELRWLEWDDVDFRQRVLHVRAKGNLWSPKSHEEREVPLSKRVLEHLQEVRRRRPEARWVCENAAQERWALYDLSRRARELFQAAGLHDPKAGTLHRLRHTFASTLAANGASSEVIRRLLGHHSITVTEVYMHAELDRMREAVESL